MAPRRADGGGCGTRSIRWVGEDGEFADILLADRETDTVTGAVSSLAPLSNGSSWVGDDHSRLVLYSWDLTRTNGPPFSFGPPGSGAPPAPPSFGETLEIPWGSSALGGGKVLDLNRSYPTARSVDIGLCSVPLPWVVEADEPRLPFLESFGFSEPGDGIAEQILTQFVEAFDDASSGIIDRRGGVIGNVSHIADRDRFYVRQGDPLAGLVDEVCFDTAWNFRYTPLGIFGGLFFPRPMCRRRMSVRFCGGFQPNGSGTVDFRVSDARAVVSGGAGPICDAWGGVIANGIEGALPGSLEPLISQEFDRRLTVQELPGFGVVSDCADLGLTEEERQLSCSDAIPNLGARCEQREGDQMPFCYWRLGVDRVEILPSRLELITADGPEDPSAALLVGLGSFVPGYCRDGGGAVVDTATIGRTFLQ